MKAVLVILFALVFVCSIAGAPAETLVTGKTIAAVITGGGSQIYELDLEAGQYAHITVEQIGIDLAVSLIDPNNTKIDEVDSPTGDQGTENIIIEAKLGGTYRLEVHPFEGGEPGDGKFNIQIEELLSADEYRERIDTERARHQAAIEWVRENGIPLKGVDAEEGFDDMQPIREIIGEANLVALGEATHGTGEFFRLKHRMLEFLVSEMGFNLFGIEATMPECFDINEYVLTGRGDPEKALAGQYFWTWNTEEVLEMIRWMRRYNADPDHTKKVKFYGFDMQSGTRALKNIQAYLNEAALESAGLLKESAPLSLIMNPYTASDVADLSAGEKREALQVIAEISADLVENRERCIAQTGEKAWEISLLHTRIATQCLMNKLPAADPMKRPAIRDSSMAANIQWIMEQEGPDAKMVVWAHNGHVATQENMMGEFLREKYGANMVVFGFVFNQGSFQAMDMPFVGTGRGLRAFHLKPMPEESFDATLAAAGHPYAAIDLRELPDEGYVADWFARPHKSRSIGAVFNSDAAAFAASFSEIEIQQPGELYDAILFVDETTAARPNPGGAISRPRSLISPENTGFEKGDPGLIPEGWRADKYRLANFDFTVETSVEEPHQGEKCVKISRKPGRHYGETYGSLSQRIDAAPYRGKSIELIAMVRTDLEGPGNYAYLWLSAGRAGFGPQSRLGSDNMKDRPITVSRWESFRIILDIPEEAQWITYGMALTGEGSAWFDQIELQVVEAAGATGAGKE